MTYDLSRVTCDMSFVTMFSVVHNCCWLGLQSDADIVVEGRVMRAALRNIKMMKGGGPDGKGLNSN